MCLKNADLDNIKEIADNCYLNHPERSDDSDDVLLDAANQCEMMRQDLIKWTTSARSFCFMDEIENIDDIDVSDFMKEFDPFL